MGLDLSRIETDEGVFYVKRTVSGLKGVEVSVNKNDNNTRFLCFEHRAICEYIG